VANPAAAAPDSGADRPRGYHCHWYNGQGHWNDWYDWDDGDDWRPMRRRVCHIHRHRGMGHGHGLIGGGVGVHIGIGGHH
jgi:hypothetical protein